ncbi:hypothetical protein Airi02_016260 [Actinoallomurus iriomotensis]|uniref:Uncharacterized protein n=1 Tax=Actinoallomurus iriomotensis TaxID=478107 RepID=A0A9W6S0U2_9ACTN|nr:hypothetical protein Airi02_016260 [Actinoallomurus iriomotensis]
MLIVGGVRKSEQGDFLGRMHRVPFVDQWPHVTRKIRAGGERDRTTGRHRRAITRRVGRTRHAAARDENHRKETACQRPHHRQPLCDPSLGYMHVMHTRNPGVNDKFQVRYLCPGITMTPNMPDMQES